MGLLAPNPRKFFEKNLTKNFQTGVCANIVRTINQRANKHKKITPLSSRFLKDRGCGGKKNFFQEVFFPPRKTKISTTSPKSHATTLHYKQYKAKKRYRFRREKALNCRFPTFCEHALNGNLEFLFLLNCL